MLNITVSLVKENSFLTVLF